jgi:hypothetical protein
MENLQIRGAVAPIVLPPQPAREMDADERATARAAEIRAIAGARAAAAIVVAAARQTAPGYACAHCPAVGLAPSDLIGAACVDCAPIALDGDEIA